MQQVRAGGARRWVLAVASAAMLAVAAAPAAVADTVGGEKLANNHRTVDPEFGAQPLPDVWADTWIIADAGTGEVLAQKGSHVLRAPASTLKMLTALTVLPRTATSDSYIATKSAAQTYGARVGLRPGRRYTMDQLWYAVFLPSANDAALAVAEANGGVQRTVRQMNEMAAHLQALDTHASTPNGLDMPAQTSSAYDLALIARAGLQQSDFARYARAKRAKFPNVKGHKQHPIYTTNRLLLHGYRGMIGVKTGFTTQAGRTYVGAAKRGKTTLLVTLMGIHESSEDAARKLLDWGFKNHRKVRAIGVLVDPVTDPIVVTTSGRAPAAVVPSHVVTTTPPPGTSKAVVWGTGLLALAAVIGALLAVRPRRRRRRARYGRHANVANPTRS